MTVFFFLYYNYYRTKNVIDIYLCFLKVRNRYAFPQSYLDVGSALYTSDMITTSKPCRELN